MFSFTTQVSKGPFLDERADSWSKIETKNNVMARKTASIVH